MPMGFDFHTPSQAGLEKLNKLNEAFYALTSAIDELIPDSREKAIAKTHVETASMWAVKAVVCNDPATKIQS